MSTTQLCANGSQKKPGAPDFIGIDTSPLCFALGIQSTLCGIESRLNVLQPKNWKELIEELITALAFQWWDSVNNRIDVAQFCSSPPQDIQVITELDIAGWVAQYYPLFSIIVTDDVLWEKVTIAYLYAKWFDLCECIPTNPGTPPHDDAAPGDTDIPEVDDSNIPTCPSGVYYVDARAEATDLNEPDFDPVERVLCFTLLYRPRIKPVNTFRGVRYLIYNPEFVQSVSQASSDPSGLEYVFAPAYVSPLQEDESIPQCVYVESAFKVDDSNSNDTQFEPEYSVLCDLDDSYNIRPILFSQLFIDCVDTCVPDPKSLPGYIDPTTISPTVDPCTISDGICPGCKEISGQVDAIIDCDGTVQTLEVTRYQGYDCNILQGTAQEINQCGADPEDLEVFYNDFSGGVG